MSPIKRGAVIEYPALFDFDSYPRPYLIVSDATHPFHGEEYIGVAITTTALESAIPIDDDAWVRGGLPKESFIKPWQPILLNHADITDAFGVLQPTVVDRAAGELASVTFSALQGGACQWTPGQASQEAGLYRPFPVTVPDFRAR